MARRERSLVREESHLDDMRAAIRGDFARLKERLGDQALLVAEGATAEDATRSDEPPPTEPPAQPSAPTADVRHASAAVAETARGSEPQRRPDARDPEPEPAPEPGLEPVPGQDDAHGRRSWVDRVLGRP